MEKLKTVFNVSSLSRVWQHISEMDRSFAVISAYLIDAENNEVNHKDLKRDIRKAGAGFIELISGYTYKVGASAKDEIAHEKNYFIPKISKKNAINLGKKYKQKSILWKDEDNFILVSTDPRVCIGETLQKFKMLKDDSLTFNKSVVKTAFSALLKGSKNQLGCKFAFLEERRIMDFPTAYMYQKYAKYGVIPEWFRIL